MNKKSDYVPSVVKTEDLYSQSVLLWRAMQGVGKQLEATSFIGLLAPLEPVAYRVQALAGELYGESVVLFRNRLREAKASAKGNVRTKKRTTRRPN